MQYTIYILLYTQLYSNYFTLYYTIHTIQYAVYTIKYTEKSLHCTTMLTMYNNAITYNIIMVLGLKHYSGV